MLSQKRVELSLIAHLAAIGTIVLESSDESTGGRPLVMPDIEAAQSHCEKLRELVNAAHRLRGVREFDMVRDGVVT